MGKTLHAFSLALAAHLSHSPYPRKKRFTPNLATNTLVVVLGATELEFERIVSSGIGPFTQCVTLPSTSLSKEHGNAKYIQEQFRDALTGRVNVALFTSVLNHNAFALMAHARAHDYKTLLLHLEFPEAQPQNGQMESFALGVKRSEYVILLRKESIADFTVTAIIDKPT